MFPKSNPYYNCLDMMLLNEPIVNFTTFLIQKEAKIEILLSLISS
jgi:hypothetical protein